MNKDITLVILAAGMGSRFGGLKQIEPIDEYNNFIIDYSIYDAIEAGFDCVTFIIKEENYIDFKESIGKRIESKIKTKYAFQKVEDIPTSFKLSVNRSKPWGTAHAILAARNIIEDNFVIINADDYYGKDAFKVAANYLRSLSKHDSGKYANVVYQVQNTITENGSVKRGLCLTGETGEFKEMVESSIERNDNNQIIATSLDNPNRIFILKGNEPVSMNMFIFTKDILSHLENRFLDFLNQNIDNQLSCEYLIPTVVSELFEEHKVTLTLLDTTSIWYGVTYKEDKEEVVSSLKELVNKALYTKGLWK